MSVTVIVGGQAGSEGKGKFVGYLARKDKFDAAICNFYTNAGHTWVSDEGESIMVQQIPQAVVNENTKLYIGPGAGITLNTLYDEINKYIGMDVAAERLKIHPRAMIIEQRHKDIEAATLGRISSTLKGCGAAQADKVVRGPMVRLARDVEELQPYIANTEHYIALHIAAHDSVMIEGSQGFDLDINYGIEYPYTTSRQTNVAQVVADCGVPVQLVDHVIAVIRCHPIRVGNQFDKEGNQVGWSGPFGGRELSWDEVTAESGSPTPLLERTTVTQKIRRIFEMDWDRLLYMVMVNKPTEFALNFVNYLDYRDYGVRQYELLSNKTKDFITKVESLTGVPVTLIGTGPRNSDIVDLREYKIQIK